MRRRKFIQISAGVALTPLGPSCTHDPQAGASPQGPEGSEWTLAMDIPPRPAVTFTVGPILELELVSRSPSKGDGGHVDIDVIVRNRGSGHSHGAFFELWESHGIPRSGVAPIDLDDWGQYVLERGPLAISPGASTTLNITFASSLPSGQVIGLVFDPLLDPIDLSGGAGIGANDRKQYAFIRTNQ